jgi:hypothetical protein
MATELEKFTDAYATLTVATYEPLILRWFSGWTIGLAASSMAWRQQKAEVIDLPGSLSTAHALLIRRLRNGLANPTLDPVAQTARSLIDIDGNTVPPTAYERLNLATHPDAIRIGNVVQSFGALSVRGVADLGGSALEGVAPAPAPGAPVAAAAPTIPFASDLVETSPSYVSGSLGLVKPGFDFRGTRDGLFEAMVRAVNTFLGTGGGESRVAAAAPDQTFEDIFFAELQNVNGVHMYEFLPRGRLMEALSPIGVAHYFRQLYFNAREGVGPLEQAFTIAPLETLEVAYETVRRQIHEEVVEVGTETVSESAVETKNLDEVSDKVSSMIQRDSSASMSVNASGSIGVWQVGGSASANMSASSQRSREETSRRLKEVTRRASERITKTFSIRTRDVQDVTTTSITRRTIKNDSPEPVSYGLRRVLRRVLVKVQDLGPRLVWQVYIRNPGGGLARSRFVHFREQGPIAVPEIPPGLRPRPAGGVDTGSTSSTVKRDTQRGVHFVALVIVSGADRRITAVSIDSITDLEGGGKDDYAPSPINTNQWGQSWNPVTRTYSVNIAILPGDALSVSVSYTYSWEPGQQVLDEWEAERKEAVAAATAAALNEQFEREKTLITERSKIRPRPPADLRREERYEVMNRMVSQLFARGDDPSEPTPLEMEYFHKFFDIDQMFTYTHPSWWKPRYTPVATGLGRPAYEITAESEPAPLGSSLGWVVQLDGDSRRNEFLNSPWVRACFPIRPNQEEEALTWLATHVEGELGYDPTQEPLKTALDSIKLIRENQVALGQNGFDFVTVDSPVDTPTGPLMPQNVFPIVDEFEVTVPTEGFVYDRLIVK